jgi:alcohol dehydrogenase class IV
MHYKPQLFCVYATSIDFECYSGLIYTPYPQVAAVLLPYYIEYLHEQDSEQYSKVLASISTALGTSDVMQWLHPLIKQLSIQHLNDCNERLNAKSMASNAELLAISLSSDTSSSGSSSVPDLLTKDIAASVYEAAM